MEKQQNPNTLVDNELLLNQKGIALWFTGLSGAGKSTIAFELEKRFYEQGYLSQVLDGDIIRLGLGKDLGYSDLDRKENIRRIAEVTKLLCNSGIITITAFISPTIEMREMARNIIGKNRFFEVFISTPLTICEQRDTKGLYKKARLGEISDFTGISSAYENPIAPFLNIDTSNQNIEDSVNSILSAIKPVVKYY